MKTKNPLLTFLCGLALLSVGLYLFLQSIDVHLGFGFSIYGYNVSTGFVLLPFIIGIVWMFINTESIGAKILTGVGLLIVVVSIIMSVHFTIYNMSLYKLLVLIIMMFGGLGMILRVLFANNEKPKTRKEEIEKYYKDL